MSDMSEEPPPPSYQEATKPQDLRAAPPQYPRRSNSDERTHLLGNRSHPYGSSYQSLQPPRRAFPRPNFKWLRYKGNGGRFRQQQSQNQNRNQRRKKPDYRACWRELFNFLKCVLVGACLGAMLVGTLFMGRWAWNGFENSGGEEKGVEVVRIGVIGAGPAGIAAAYTLSKHKFSTNKNQKDIKLEITIFEQNSRVGGRLVIPQSHNNIGTLYHELHAEDLATSCLARDSLLTSRARAAGIEFGTVGRGDESITTVAFSTAESVVAELPRPRSELGYWAWLKIFLSYGPSVSFAAWLPDGTMLRYRSMLSHTRGNLYESAWGILLDGGLTDSASLSAIERLKRNRVKGKYVEEIVRPQVRRQTGNELEDLSDLVLSMALEREGLRLCVDGLEGWFQSLMKSFVDASMVMVDLDTQVTGMKYAASNEAKSNWIIEATNLSNSTSEKNYKSFDHVILATPFNGTRLGLGDVVNEVTYKSAYTTFISSTAPPGDLQQVLYITSSDGQIEIHEVSYIRQLFHLNSLVNTTYLYKITSNASLTNEHIDSLFEKRYLKEILGVEIENAWPLAMPRSTGDDLGLFEVEGKERLWGTGGGEVLGTGVEWSWVLGEGVAGAVGRGVERDRARSEGTG